VLGSLPSEGGVVAPNLTFLGKSGVRTLPGQLTVAYLSGAPLPAAALSPTSAPASLHTYQPTDIAHLSRAALATAPRGGLDVLLTSEIPARCTALLPADAVPAGFPAATAAAGCAQLSVLASALPLRYHFASTARSCGGCALTLPPYRAPHGLPVRLYGLAPLGNENKARDTAAFALTPIAVAVDSTEAGAASAVTVTTAEEVAAVTECPYTAGDAAAAAIARAAPAAAAAAAAAALVIKPAETPAPAPAVAPVSVAAAALAAEPDGPLRTQRTDNLRFASLEDDLSRGGLGGGLGSAGGYSRWANRPPPGYTCRICGSLEHFIRDCPQAAAPRGTKRGREDGGGDGHGDGQGGERRARAGPPPSDYECHACGARGEHWIRDCAVAIERQQQRAAREADPYVKPPEGYTCVACGSGDHYVRVCPDRQRARTTGGGGQAGLQKAVRVLAGAGFMQLPDEEDVPQSTAAAAAPPPAGARPRTRFIMSSVLMRLAEGLQAAVEKATAEGLPLAPVVEGDDPSANAVSEGDSDAQKPAGGLAAVIEAQRARDLAVSAHAETAAAAETALATAAGLDAVPETVGAVLRALPPSVLEALVPAVQAEAERAEARRAARAARAARPAAATDAECWFCLSNARAATHLVVAVGAEAYVAMPRGPLTPEHALVLPVAHVACAAAAAPPLRAEAAGLCGSLTRMHAAAGRVAVTVERYIKTRATHHMQVQVVGVTAAAAAALPVQVEADSLARGLRRVPYTGAAAATAEGAESALRAALEAARDAPGDDTPQYVLWTFPATEAKAAPECQLWLVTPTARERERGRERDAALVAAVGLNAAEEKVSTVGLLDAPRALLAAALGEPSRADWKTCVSSAEEEAEMTATLKKQFAAFDPTEDDDSDSESDSD
jgi:hypothetical protein